MVGLKVFVEGGGTVRADQQMLREGMAKLIARALPEGTPKPKVSAEGGRGDAFKGFGRAIAASQPAMLLVDSEALVDEDLTPWQHVARRPGDEWARPDAASDDDLHFMAVTMEAWLVADVHALESYFGAGFKAAELPQAADVERVPKDTLYDALKDATKGSKKGSYAKKHGSELIGKIDPAKVTSRAKRFAPRFFDELRKRMGADS